MAVSFVRPHCTYWTSAAGPKVRCKDSFRPSVRPLRTGDAVRDHQLGKSFLIKFNNPAAPLVSPTAEAMLSRVVIVLSHKKLSLVYDSERLRRKKLP